MHERQDLLQQSIVKRLGLKGSTTDELVQSLIQMVKDFRVAMNMPTTLKELGLSEDRDMEIETDNFEFDERIYHEINDFYLDIMDHPTIRKTQV